MNKKGVFCFLLVLAFAGTGLALQENQDEKFAGAKNICFELEKLDLERAILEENTDFLAEETLRLELLLGNKNPESIKKKTNAKLAVLLGKQEDFLNENSEVLVIEYEGLVFAEYSFTGGLLRNNFLRLKLESENAEKIFELPIGYSVKVVQ